MRLRFLIALGLAAVAAAGASTGAAVAQTPFRPVAVVNDSAITGFDLAQRALILSALGYPSDAQEQIRTAALDQLVEDKLKLQAGKRVGITPSPEIIETGIEEYARLTGTSPDGFRQGMRARGVTDQALEDMVAAQVVWLDVIRRRFGDQVQPAEADIDAEMARSGVGETEYRVLEIGLPLTGDGRTEAETRALAEELSASLGQGGDFGAAVARYSDAPSAARGGEVGWVTSGRMPPELRQTLSGLEVGQVSPPVPVGGGISILKLVDKRQTGGGRGGEPRSREQVREALITERSERLAEGLMQEMRRDALIEVR
jgi:peptidyl-prolyl cis-trans isomerase SurA